MTLATQSPWRRTGSEPVYANPWFRVREDSVIRPDGTSGIYGVIEIEPYAGVVAVNDDGRIALVRQWRYLYDEPSLEIPAGGSAQHDTTPLDTAKRELQEETGITATDWTSLGTVRYSVATHVGHLFLARGLTLDTQTQPTQDEDVDDWTELIWTDYHEAIDLMLNGEIKESTSLAALGKAEALRHRGSWSLH